MPLLHLIISFTPIRSLKIANVMSISKEIKEKHLFKDYEDLRAYWKNMVQIYNINNLLKLIFPKFNFIDFINCISAEIKIN